MQQRRWLNQTQPQTLQIAVMLLYLNSALTFLLGVIPYGSLLLLLIVLGQVAAAYGIANEMRWGYALGISMTILPFVIRYIDFGNPFVGIGIIGLMFDIAMLALLLHPQSREYQKLWFK